MTDTPEFLSGFNQPRPTDDGYVTGQYERLGIGPTPSLADIEPHALAMLRGRRLAEGMGLVLGRRVDARELPDDPDLMGIAALAMTDPEQAFGGLLLKLAIDERNIPPA